MKYLQIMFLLSISIMAFADATFDDCRKKMNDLIKQNSMAKHMDGYCECLSAGKKDCQAQADSRLQKAKRGAYQAMLEEKSFLEVKRIFTEALSEPSLDPNSVSIDAAARKTASCASKVIVDFGHKGFEKSNLTKEEEEKITVAMAKYNEDPDTRWAYHYCHSTGLIQLFSSLNISPEEAAYKICHKTLVNYSKIFRPTDNSNLVFDVYAENMCRCGLEGIRNKQDLTEVGKKCEDLSLSVLENFGSLTVKTQNPKK